ncbi:hypothetical protein WICMUC_001500 [Wickerhamomyces mucosus]|uniref:F-box domain-containing protein n=1 Tax=Wickerhamomyces mucosus TaxID=1378264 RepID=A0A9P8TG95_9ASCO|nr:hypothetical protein WICMUC_001500 [Wickerhamomyces mucosus]
MTKVSPDSKLSISSFPIIGILPTELQSYIVFFLQQDDLIELSLVSKFYYNLAIQQLYKRIYLNDSFIETSEINHLYRLASNWSWLKLPSDLDIEGAKSEANYKLKLLIRSLDENLELNNKVVEVRLNWDLNIDLQLILVQYLTNNSNTIRIIENITDPKLNIEGVQNSRFGKNLTSLDLPPPYPLPESDLPSIDYIPGLYKHLSTNLTQNLKHLTLFIDPLQLFNNIIRPNFKLELESFKLHCRSDSYPPEIYRKQNWKFFKLSDIFDIRYLKNLTIISWFDHYPFSDVFKFDHWIEFENLQDITLIAVEFNDLLISKLIRACKNLKRLKLDFGNILLLRENTLIYRAIFSPKVLKTLKFLDIKLYFPDRIFSIDIRDFTFMFKELCSCSFCKDHVYPNILRGKIVRDGNELLKVGPREFYQKVSYYDHFFCANLLPYSKAVDRFPSVKTSSETIETFLNAFNELNSTREDFIPLNEDDFYDLFQCLIHSWKLELTPFIESFQKLKFIVLNDVSIMIQNEGEKKFPVPLFYNRNYQTNF